MVVVEYAQLTLEPAEPRKPLPRPSSLAPGCAERDPATDPPLPGLRCRCGRWSGDPALMSGEPLPELLDAKDPIAELGVTRVAAEAIMRQLAVVQVDGLRRCTAAVATWRIWSPSERLQTPKWRDDVKGPDTSRVRGTLGDPSAAKGCPAPSFLFRIGPVGSFLTRKQEG